MTSPLREPAFELAPQDSTTSARPVGSLCSGYGGLDLAVEHFFDGQVVWHCETDPAASRVLERHWPGVPNAGDIRTVPWPDVRPVCVLTAGFPCQRRLGRRSAYRSRPVHPLGPVAARRARHQGPPPLPGGDRKRPRTTHLPRRPLSRRGTLPVVHGRPGRSWSAGTRRRTRLLGRPPV
nr:DNA cytosine methyltransferase [Streptomyces sp. SPB074]